MTKKFEYPDALEPITYGYSSESAFLVNIRQMVEDLETPQIPSSTERLFVATTTTRGSNTLLVLNLLSSRVVK